MLKTWVSYSLNTFRGTHRAQLLIVHVTQEMEVQLQLRILSLPFKHGRFIEDINVVGC